jgi:hypothetical protein
MRSSLLGYTMLLFALSGCGSQQRAAQPTRGVTSMQGAGRTGPTNQDQGWAALVEADREMNALAGIRDGATDPFQRRAIDRRIAELSARSHKLMDDMTVFGRPMDDAAVRADVTTLHRAMHAGAATEKQAASRGQR